MSRLLLNSEARKTNGAIKPCQIPRQMPAITFCEIGVPFDWLALSAHPAVMNVTNDKNTNAT